jgi:hypothetical protein
MFKKQYIMLIRAVCWIVVFFGILFFIPNQTQAQSFCACGCGQCCSDCTSSHQPEQCHTESYCSGGEDFYGNCMGWSSHWVCNKSGDADECPPPYNNGNCCALGCPGPGPGPTPDPGDDDDSCSATSPAAPVLMSPADGAKAQAATVTLQWEPTLSWGVNCTGANIYLICVDSW